MPLSVPAARELPASVDATILDSHTIPIIFGTIGVLLAFVAIVVNIWFGVLQIRAINNRARDDVECCKGALLPAAAAINEATTRATLATHTESRARETFPNDTTNHQHVELAPHHLGERESLRYVDLCYFTSTSS